MRLRLNRPSMAGAGLAAIAAALALVAPGLAFAQSDPTFAPAPSGVIRVDLARAGASENISIPRGKSAVVELPIDARDVMISNPSVADAVLRSPRRIYVVGVTPGATDAAFFDAAGRRILALNIRVDQDFAAVADTINRLVPGARVHVEGVNTSMVLTGQVPSAIDADHAVQVAQQFVGKPEQVVNMLGITGKDQVMLKVRVVEVQRNVVKQLGFNTSTLVGQANNSQFLFANSATFGVNGALLGGVNGSGYCYNKAGVLKPGAGSVQQGCATIDAFERVGLVRILAEPNLTAVSGEAAHFLAGGEFPVPTGSDNTGRTTVEFKDYGVGLGFTPVVLSGGRISLKVSTEVSELTNLGSFSISSGGSGTSITIPGLNVRRAETVVELPSGGAMMIAGLLREETKQNLDALPGLMNLPVLGALFRSRDYQEGETELAVIVTPYLVTSTSPAALQTPADGLQIANDAETIFMGRLTKTYKAPPAAVAGRTYQGPVGYVIE